MFRRPPRGPNDDAMLLDTYSLAVLPGFVPGYRLLLSCTPESNGGVIPMSTDVKSTAIPPEVMADLQRAAENAAKGLRDREVMLRAAQRMDQMREETYRKHGLLNIGLSAIRELRNSV